MPFQIHWQEGLFLLPHHLQRMQKSASDQISIERQLSWPYPWGVVEMRLSRDELENMRIRFDRLRAIMPSGLEVNFPDTAELPSLDIKQAFSKGSGSFNVSLGVPWWQPAKANSFPSGQQADPRIKLLYRVSEVECVDENTGENPKPLQVRKVNARLMLDHEDSSEMELIPLLRIVRAAGQDLGMPREDSEYVPPCLVLNGSPSLRELIRDLVSQVEASRKELVVQVNRGGFSTETLRGIQFEQLTRLRTLNRYSARLPSLIQAPALTPFAIYLELRSLLGELAALHPDRDEFESAPYDHTNLLPCFRELSVKIRSFLRGAVAPTWRKLDFKETNGTLTIQLTDEDLNQPNAYFLGVKTKLDPIHLARLVEDGDKFKLMPPSLLVRGAIRGVELKEERHAPLELPAQSDLHYFRLDRTASARLWQQVQVEKAAAIRCTTVDVDLSGTVFSLYMTVPHGVAAKGN